MIIQEIVRASAEACIFGFQKKLKILSFFHREDVTKFEVDTTSYNKSIDSIQANVGLLWS